MAKHRVKAISNLNPQKRKLRDAGKTNAGGIFYPQGTPTSAVEQELFRQSPALHVANTVLNNMRRENKASLADTFVSSTYEWCKAFKFTAKQEKAVTPILRAYRQAMRHANRFVLDNDFVEQVTHVSNRTAPEKLLYRLQFATLPYQTTWIEFDLRAKVRVMREYHGVTGVPIGVSDRMGLLLERVTDTMSTVTMICEGGWSENHELTFPNLTGYVFSLDERTLLHDQVFNGLTPFATQVRLGILKNFPGFEDINTPYGMEVFHRVSRGALWGYGKGQIGVIAEPKDLVDNIHIPDFLARHGEVAFTRAYDFFELGIGGGGPMPKMASVINQEIAEFAGMGRWLVNVLAMLNEVPVSTQLIQPDHTIRAGLTARRPAMDYHLVTLRLPKTKPTPWIERQLSAVGRRLKAHEVREHWRTYLQPVCCGREDHQWEYDYAEGYRLCGKCMSYSRLIHEHVRGDPSLGWVRKDYLLKPNKQE